MSSNLPPFSGDPIHSRNRFSAINAPQGVVVNLLTESTPQAAYPNLNAPVLQTPLPPSLIFSESTTPVEVNNEEEDESEENESKSELESYLEEKLEQPSPTVPQGNSTSSSGSKSRQCLGNLPYWLVCLIRALSLITFFFVVLGLPDFFFGLKTKDEEGKYLSYLDWTSTVNIGGMPTLNWAIFLSLSCIIHYATLMLVSFLPKWIEFFLSRILHPSLDLTVDFYLNLFRAVRISLTVTLWFFFSFLLWSFYVLIPNWRWRIEWVASLKPESTIWYYTILQTLLSLFACAALWTLERLIIKLIASKFHRRAYRDRIQQAEKVDVALLKLTTSKWHWKDPLSRHSMNPNLLKMISSRSQAAFMRPKTISDATTPTMASSPVDEEEEKEKAASRNPLWKAAKNTILASPSSTMASLDTSSLITLKAIPDTMRQAEQLANKLFSNLSQGKSEITAQAFVPYFQTYSKAKKAFRLFDKNDDGNLSLDELKSKLMEYTQEKIDLTKSMMDMKRVVGSLHYFFGALAFFLAVILACLIFEVTIKAYLSTVFSILLPSSFIFGSTLRETFECIISIFVKNYYDVGDTLIIDKEVFSVKSISILTTVLETRDGKCVFQPNTTLNSKRIDNVRRSGNMNEEIELKLDYRTSQEQLDELTQRMNAFLTTDSKHYNPTFSIIIKEVLLAEKALKCSVYISYKFNWQEMSRRNQKRNAFMYALKDNINALGLECPPPYVFQ